LKSLTEITAFASVSTLSSWAGATSSWKTSLAWAVTEYVIRASFAASLATVAVTAAKCACR